MIIQAKKILLFSTDHFYCPLYMVLNIGKILTRFRHASALGLKRFYHCEVE